MAKKDRKKKLFQLDCSHSAAAERRLTSNGAHSSRIIVADSYFSSAAIFNALGDAGLRLIGSIKSATKGHPKMELSQAEAEGRGFIMGMARKKEGKQGNMAIALVDSKRNHFISTAMTPNLTEAIIRERYRKASERARLVSTSMKIPEAVATHCSASSKANERDRCRQGDLDIEKKLEVKNWSVQVNSILLGMRAVDAWFLCKGARSPRARMDPVSFARGWRSSSLTIAIMRRESALEEAKNFMKYPKSYLKGGIEKALIKAKRRRRSKEGALPDHAYQRR